MNEADDLKAQRTRNLELWDAVKVVPKEHRKDFTVGKNGPKLTAIDPCYLIWLATQTWGPCGQGWGYEIVGDEIIGEKQERLHTMRVAVWYGDAVDSSSRKPFPVYGVGCTPLYVKAGDKWFVDSDFNKKTLTDAIGNALWRLGFGADVRMGKQSESKYEDSQAPDSLADAELVKEWEVVASWRRVAEGLSEEQLPFAVVVSVGVEWLQAHTQVINAESVRGYLKHLKSSEAKIT